MIGQSIILICIPQILQRPLPPTTFKKIPVTLAVGLFFGVLKRCFATGIPAMKVEMSPFSKESCKRFVECPMNRAMMFNSPAISVFRRYVHKLHQIPKNTNVVIAPLSH